MNQPAEAGPSRPSPPRIPPPILDTSSTDIVMEDVSTSTQVEGPGESDDAVALLLNISSAVDVPPKPESLEVVMEDQDQSRLVEVEKSAPPDVHSYPYTPPEDKDINDQPTVPPPSASASLSNILTSSHADNSSPSASAHPPTPTRTSPDPPVKTKGKRKRNTTSGSSRRTSSDHPAHWLGEDNTIIRCICGFTEDDGFTIQCENCGAWEHGICFGYVDAASAPEQYFCELCEPRPFDAAAAKQMQIMMQNQQRQSRIPPPLEGDIIPPEREKEKPRSKGGKTKRSRTESMVDGDLDKDKESGKEHSPGVMGPPASKPKRRQPGPKPRPKQNTNESSSTPGPSTFKEQQSQQQQPILEEPEDDYFRVEPWALEYTPIKENIVRGVLARQIMRNVYKEWVDAEEEMMAAKSRAVHNPSGLPSPTETGVLRLSPDNLFPPPDFHILAPPVPPIFLSGPDLESLGSPISIQVVEDAPSFLPLTYTENISKHGVYTRPTIYSVFTEEPVTFGSFIGEYKGEIIDCETYRKDPINQYSSLGLPKPYVRSIGPPINLMIDARGYGNDLRFVRSGCHPNVVLRPLLWRSTESDSLKLKFGLFASKDIGKKDELVLGWEWDDQHVVHSLRSIVHAAMLNDGSLASPGFSASPRTINSLSHKIDSVLTHIFGTFTACACVIPGTCALAQMGQLVEPKMMQDNLVHENGRKKLRVDLGELVGAVRGWRRRELENAEMKKWRLNEGQAFDLGLTRMSSRTSEAQSSAQSEDQQERSSDKAGDESMEQDPEEGTVLKDVQQAVHDQKEEAVIPEVKQQEDDDARMEVESPSAIAESPPAPAAQLPAESENLEDSTTIPAIASPTKSPLAETHINIQSVQQPSSPILKPISSPSAPRTPKVERQDSSSSLSSAISSIKPSLADDMDVDSGSESDATTATIPKTQSSESEAESDITSEEEQEKVLIRPPSKESVDAAMSSEEERSSPAKPKSGGNARKVRRVLSPIIESSKHVNGHHDLSEDEREMIINKPKKNKVQIPDSSPKTSTFQPLAMSDIKKVAASKGKRGRTKRIVSSSASEDESENEMRVHGKVLPKKRRKSKDSRSSPKSAKSIKLENLENIPHPHDTEEKEEPRAVVPDQVTAPLSTAMEMDEVAIPDPEVVPPVEPQPAPEAIVEEEQPREPTPPPREPTPPPPEPPKKVSLSDYLKSHKFRKESQTPVTEAPPPVPLPKVDNVTPTPEVGKNGASTFDDIPGFGNIPSTVNVNVNGSPVKAEPETPSMGGKLNLSEYLPSNKPVSNGSVEPPRTSSYVPRTVSGGSADYFPPQSQPVTPAPPATSTSSAFVPRVHSSSYIPRQTSISSENGSLSTPGTGANDPSNVTLGLTKSPIDVTVPLPLPVREPPPHSTTPGKLPPTGPKVPPTGPRGLGVPPPGQSVGSSPVSVIGGFRGGERGRGHRGGMWRGRGGGFRGGWRGS